MRRPLHTPRQVYHNLYYRILKPAHKRISNGSITAQKFRFGVVVRLGIEQLKSRASNETRCKYSNFFLNLCRLIEKRHIYPPKIILTIIDVPRTIAEIKEVIA